MSAMASQITGISIVCSIVCSSVDQRKHQSSASLAFVMGIHPWPVDSPHKGPVMLKTFLFDDVTMIHIITFILYDQQNNGLSLHQTGPSGEIKSIMPMNVGGLVYSHTEVWAKGLTRCRWQFKCILLSENGYSLHQISLEFVPKGLIDNEWELGSGNGLVPKMWWTITWTNVELTSKSECLQSKNRINMVGYRNSGFGTFF